MLKLKKSFFLGRKLFLRPAKTGLQKIDQQNGNAAPENGNSNSFSPNNNPFLKCDKEEVEKEKNVDSKTRDPAENNNKDKITEDLFKAAKTNPFTNATTLSENSNFVFGQNLHERVVIVSTQDNFFSYIRYIEITNL